MIKLGVNVYAGAHVLHVKAKVDMKGDVGKSQNCKTIYNFVNRSIWAFPPDCPETKSMMLFLVL